MTNNEKEPTQRIIQEYVPGKQVTLAHVISAPQKGLFAKLGLEDNKHNALGMVNITPSEGLIIAADVASKAADVEINFLSQFGGSLVIVGDISSVETALTAVLAYFDTVLHYTLVEMTRS